MQLTFVDRDGVSLMMESNISIPDMIEMRHHGAQFYNHQRPDGTVAGVAGLNYSQLETLRSSQTWEDESNSFIRHMGLYDSDKVRESLGVMGSSRRKVRSSEDTHPRQSDAGGWIGAIIGGVIVALWMWHSHVEDEKEYWRRNPTPAMRRERQNALNEAYDSYRYHRSDNNREELRKQLRENNIHATPEEYDSVYRTLRGE